MSDILDDEFRFLAGQAASLDVNVPVARRIAIETTAGTVSALRFGDAAPRVTFLHGAGLNAHTWDTTVLALGAPALVLDLPGHGDSAWRADADYSPATLGATVAEAIASQTTTPQVLVGQSLGGLTATWVAAHRPELVDSLVIVDITPGIDQSHGPAALRAFYGVQEFPSRDAVVDHAISFGLGGDREATERGVFFNTRVREDGVVEWKHHFARLATVIIPEDAPTTSLDPSGWEDLAAVNAPITLVRGDTGFVSAEAREEFAQRVPQATITDVVAGHNVQETAPAELANVISHDLT